MTLSPSEERALAKLDAPRELSTIDTDELAIALERLAKLGLAAKSYVPHRREWDFVRTPAGTILAQTLKASSRLERAREKLKEWEKRANDSAVLEVGSAGPWCAILMWSVRETRSESDDPLTAAIEASKRTPWVLEE